MLAKSDSVMRFGKHLAAAGYLARGRQIIDPAIVSVPKQYNTKDENEGKGRQYAGHHPIAPWLMIGMGKQHSPLDSAQAGLGCTA